MERRVEIVVTPKVSSDVSLYLPIAASVAGVNLRDVVSSRLLRKSIDARKRGEIKVNMCVSLFFEGDDVKFEEFHLDWGDVSCADEVVIVGGGPAGLFAALELIELGLRPIILERGKSVSDRKHDLASLNRNGAVDGNSNYCFGEGGAGTYSDGKLYTRSKKRGENRKVLEILVHHGAGEEILYDAHPHIGTDQLPRIISNIRHTIERSGGVVKFGSLVTDYVIKDGRIEGVVLANGDVVNGKSVILATGHSARDVYEVLHDRGVELQPKDFAVGVRVEHKQSLINFIQYKGSHDDSLPNASYSLVSQVGGRGVYSFCMCPGGFIVPAATSSGECVVNGMSPSGRNNIFANSGIVASVRQSDLGDYEKHYGVLAGLRFQQQLEKLGWSMGGGRGVVAPAQRLDDFVSRRPSQGVLESSYHPGLVSSDMHAWLPKFLGSALRGGFIEFDKKMRGFITSDAQIIGIESRTSSVLRIPRDRDSMEHISVKGLYPVGEGAGYAGGIVSSAIDGMVVAHRIKH